MFEPIRPVRSQDDHARVLDEIAGLMDAAAGTPEAERLEVLSVLAAEYERRSLSDEADPIDVLATAMQTEGRSQAELARVLGSRARASEVLSRRRGLSGEMIARIAQAWSIPERLLAGRSRLVASAAVQKAAKTVAMGLVLVLGVAGGVLGWAAYDLPSVEPLTREAARPQAARLDALPAHVPQAFLSAQDRAFYRHSGYDVGALIRAEASNLEFRGRLHGGSTISQQLVKTTLLKDERRSLRRKLREIILARRLEHALPKDRILEAYLDHAYFGRGAWGLGEAAERYFAKPASALSLDEAAFLAIAPNAPGFYGQALADRRPDAREGRDRVLERMRRNGFLTDEALLRARAEPLGLDDV